MTPDAAPALIWATVVLIFAFVVFARARQKRSGRRHTISIGPAASGAIYDLLNEDKRNAIELIVEEKAEARDPETADDVVDPHAHH
jgi:hypothetical protein